jgi:hypothetical protein
MEIKTEQMRGCIIGPCTNEEKDKIKELLLECGEVVEPQILWDCLQDTYTSVQFFSEDDDWGTTDKEPSISPGMFFKKYFSPPEEIKEPGFFDFFHRIYARLFKKKSD